MVIGMMMKMMIWMIGEIGKAVMRNIFASLLYFLTVLDFYGKEKHWLKIFGHYFKK